MEVNKVPIEPKGYSLPALHLPRRIFDHFFKPLASKDNNNCQADLFRKAMGTNYCFMTLLTSEHMVHFDPNVKLHDQKLLALRSLNALDKTLKLLQEIGPKFDVDGEENPIFLLSRQLEYAKKAEEKYDEKGSRLNTRSVDVKISKAAQYKLSSVQKLKEGESLVIQANVKRHAMAMRIVCTNDEDGKKTYKVEHHNEGGGISQYHHSSDIDGKKKYQTVLEFEDVTQDKLSLQFFTQMLENAIHEDDTQKGLDNLYTNILSQLGRPSPPSQDKRHWSSGQKGGSCSAQCILSVIRSQLTEEQYSRFKTLARTKMLMMTVEDISKGKGDIATKKVIALEVVRKMEKHHAKRDLPLPKEVRELKEQLTKLDVEPSEYSEITKKHAKKLTAFEILGLQSNATVEEVGLEAKKRLEDLGFKEGVKLNRSHVNFKNAKEIMAVEAAALGQIMHKDPFEFLGVQANASIEEIQKGAKSKLLKLGFKEGDSLMSHYGDIKYSQLGAVFQAENMAIDMVLERDSFKILGVSPHATADEIRRGAQKEHKKLGFKDTDDDSHVNYEKAKIIFRAERFALKKASGNENE